MYRIAIVDDETEVACGLQQMIGRCAEALDEQVETFVFTGAVRFLTNYQANYDIVFMDIEMPDINGMECAERLRKIDRSSLLIFATNLGHMAALGYSVEAFDFIVKPISYEMMLSKLKRAFGQVQRNRVHNITFVSEGVRMVIPSAEILYLEVANHHLLFHTESGNYPVYGTMTNMRGKLEPLGFSLCNNCYLVNLRFVRRVEKMQVTVGSDVLQISRPRKKAFLQALNDYIGA